MYNNYLEQMEENTVNNEYNPTLEEYLTSKQNNMRLCAGHPVILAADFESTAEGIIEYNEVKKTFEEVIAIFEEQAKRFSACGANNADRYGVLRKNPKGGWSYLTKLLTE